MFIKCVLDEKTCQEGSHSFVVMTQTTVPLWVGGGKKDIIRSTWWTSNVIHHFTKKLSHV